MKKKVIKCIIIDNAGVLINTDCIGLYKKLAKLSPYSWQHIAKYIEDRDFHIMEMGKISSREWFNRIIGKFKIKGLSYTDFKKKWVGIFYRNRQMEKFVKKNYKKYKIWMLTNTNSIHYSYLRKKFSVYNFIKKKIISYHIKMAKPDKDIYQYTLKKINLKPEECLFIDNKKENIITARKLGINSIWYRNFKQFQRDLKRFKI